MTAGSKVIALGGTDAVPAAVIDQYDQCYKAMLKSVFNQKGVYGPSTGTTTIVGSLAVEDSGITVQNTIIEGDLLLGEGIGSGTVELKNVTVKGRTTVRGGWYNRITADGFASTSLVIDITKKKGAKVEFFLYGKSKVSNVTICSNAYLDESENTSEGFANVDIVSGEEAYLEGSYKTVSFSSEGIDLDLGASTVTTLNAGSGGTVWASEKIGTANISANHVCLDIIPGLTNVASGYEAYVGGTWIPEGKYTTAQITSRLEGAD
jgi:hypothetical protein